MRKFMKWLFSWLVDDSYGFRCNDLGSALSIGGSILGGILGDDASEDAANAQTSSANKATQLQREMFYQSRSDQLPYMVGGRTAYNALLALMGLPQVTNSDIGYQAVGSTPTTQPEQSSAPGLWGTMANGVINASNGGNNLDEIRKKQLPINQYGGTANDLLNSDPSYQWRLAQGEQALERSAAARGGLLSGRAAKDLTGYAQGMASTEYGNIYNRLANIAGLGQSTGSQIGQLGANYANQAGQNIIGAGNARASGYVGSANAWNNAIGQGVNAFNQYNALNSPAWKTPDYNPNYYTGGAAGSTWTSGYDL